MYRRIYEFLNEQSKNNQLRKLNEIAARENGIITVRGERYVDMSSNDYLGFSGHPHIKKRAIEYIRKYGSSGSASRLLSGNFEYHEALERRIAQWQHKESALLFGNGYIANATIIPAISTSNTIIFADKYIHASIIDGIRLSGSRFVRYRHNDMAHLNALLQKERSKYADALIIAESVYSMDGDIAPVADLIALKKEYNAALYIDEAHAVGVFGAGGSGIIDNREIAADVDVILGTFGKALGNYGAFAALNKKLRQYLINRGRGFIFSTSLPPSIIGGVEGALDLLETEPQRREELIAKTAFFRDELEKAGVKYEVMGNSQIVPLIIGAADKTVALSNNLLRRGFYALPIRPPTVPANSSRIRFSMTYNVTRQQILKLIKVLNDYAV